MTIKPFIKWVGGKTKILDDVLKHFPKEIDTYYEPFAGGGSVFLELLNRVESKEFRIKHFIISDKLGILIQTYKMVKDTPQELLKELNKIYSEIKNHKEDFYKYREEFNQESIDSLRKVSLFLYLNKNCFRGLYRSGPRGFNVPYGYYKKVNKIDEDNLLEVSGMLNKYNVEFHQRDFDQTPVCDDYFVYLDPPYYPLKRDSFTSYNSGGFTEEDFDRLVRFCSRNKRFIQSNSKTEYNQKNYSAFTILDIRCSKSINSVGRDELIIVGDIS